MAKRIITISREFGSSGRFIGEEVAKKLGVTYYDKDIIGQIAEQSELSPKKGLFAYDFYTEQKWGMAGNYTLSLNSSVLGYDMCQKIIMDCAKK